MKAGAAILAALLAVGVLFYVYTAPVETSAEMTDAEIAQIEAEVEGAAAALLESFRTIDPEAVGEGFHPTETSWVWGGTIHDRTSLVERLGSFFGNWEAWDGGWVETTVRVLTPDAAMFQGKYQSTVHYTDGRVLHWPGNANYTMLMERTPDGWKATIGDMDNGASEAVEEG